MSNSAVEVVDDLESCAEDADTVTFGALLDQVGRRSHAPLLILPPLIELTPIGGIPGVPTALAVTVLIAAVQIVAGVEHLWVPAFIENRELSGSMLRKGLPKLESVAETLDSWLVNRLEGLVSPRAQRLVGLVIIGLCATVPPLELIPFASSVPMVAIACFGFAFLVHDGLLVLIGLLISAGATGTLLYTLMGN